MKHYHVGTGCEGSRCDSFHISTWKQERPREHVFLTALNIFKEQHPLQTHSATGAQNPLVLRISQWSSTLAKISLLASAKSSEKGVLHMPFWFLSLASLQQTRMLIGEVWLIKSREAKETVRGVEGEEQRKKGKFKLIINNISALQFLGGIS